MLLIPRKERNIMNLLHEGISLLEDCYTMRVQNWKKQVFTIPNILSLFRLILIPVYIHIYLNAQSLADYHLAAAILAVSCLTDAVDGQIARRFNMITAVGKVLDPLADKITQFTLIVCLAIRHPVLWSLIGLFVAKELFQFVAGYIIVRHGRILKGAQISGKICTTILFISLTLLVLLPDIHPNWVLGITIVDGLFLLIAFIDYIFVYVRKSEELTEELHLESKEE